MDVLKINMVVEGVRRHMESIFNDHEMIICIQSVTILSLYVLLSNAHYQVVYKKYYS